MGSDSDPFSLGYTERVGEQVRYISRGTLGTERQQPVLGATAWKRLQMEMESLLKLAPKEATVQLP